MIRGRDIEADTAPDDDRAIVSEVKAPELWAPTVGALPHAGADARERGLPGEERRWRAQAIVAPIEQLVRSLSHAQIDDERYDVRRLSQRAIDVVVASMGFAAETTESQLIESLTELARAMSPDASADEWTDVAGRVYRGLLNEQHDYEKFAFTAIGPDGVRRPFSFRLLVLRQADESLVVVASDEAINVFLSALDLDPSDAEAAYGAVLERQLEEGRFEAAERSAANAGRASLAMAARIAEVLDAVRRDVRAVDWAGSARPELDRALRHVISRIPEDDRLLAKARDGTDADDEAVRAASGRIADVVRRSKELHLALERRLVTAHDVFLDAQRIQRLARRERLRLLSTERELLIPTLALPVADALAVTDAFADGVMGLRVPRQLRVASMIEVLLAGGRQTEPREIEAEDAGDPEATGPDIQTYKPESVAAASDVLAAALIEPRRLSSLLDDARRSEDEVVELVFLNALWAYAPEAGEADSGHELTVAGLAALDDGSRLDDPDFAGADLLVGAADVIAAREAPVAPPPPVPDEPISLAAARRERR